MTIVQPSLDNKSGRINAKLVGWEGLTPGDAGYPLSFSVEADKSVHIYGTFSGSTAVLEGSNDPRANPDHPDHGSAVWTTLEDASGTLISESSDSLKQVLVNPWYLRPRVEAGSGTINVFMLVK